VNTGAGGAYVTEPVPGNVTPANFEYVYANSTVPEPAGTVIVIDLPSAATDPTVTDAPATVTDAASIASNPTPVTVTVPPSAATSDVDDTLVHDSKPPLSNHFNVGYDPSAIFHTSVSHAANVEAVFISAVVFPPVVVVNGLFEPSVPVAVVA
jgi:hypothetical protein